MGRFLHCKPQEKSIKHGVILLWNRQAYAYTISGHIVMTQPTAKKQDEIIIIKRLSIVHNIHQWYASSKRGTLPETLLSHQHWQSSPAGCGMCTSAVTAAWQSLETYPTTTPSWDTPTCLAETPTALQPCEECLVFLGCNEHTDNITSHESVSKWVTQHQSLRWESECIHIAHKREQPKIVWNELKNIEYARVKRNKPVNLW